MAEQQTEQQSFKPKGPPVYVYIATVRDKDGKVLLQSELNVPSLVNALDAVRLIVAASPNSTYLEITYDSI